MPCWPTSCSSKIWGARQSAAGRPPVDWNSDTEDHSLRWLPACTPAHSSAQLDLGISDEFRNACGQHERMLYFGKKVLSRGGELVRGIQARSFYGCVPDLPATPCDHVTCQCMRHRVMLMCTYHDACVTHACATRGRGVVPSRNPRHRWVIPSVAWCFGFAHAGATRCSQSRNVMRRDEGYESAVAVKRSARAGMSDVTTCCVDLSGAQGVHGTTCSLHPDLDSTCRPCMHTMAPPAPLHRVGKAPWIPQGTFRNGCRCIGWKRIQPDARLAGSADAVACARAPHVAMPDTHSHAYVLQTPSGYKRVCVKRPPGRG